MKEKGQKKSKNPYKISLFVIVGIVVLVGLYFGFSALQNSAFQQGVQQGAVTAESNVVQQINANQEIPVIVGEEGNQTVQWIGIGQVCTAMIQQSQGTQQQDGQISGQAIGSEPDAGTETDGTQ